MTRWVAPTPAGSVTGTVRVPGSKSATARSYVLAGLADGPSTLSGVLTARDTLLMRAGLAALGVRFDDLEADVVRVTPPDAFTPGRVDVGLAGTVMRFLPPIAALARGRSEFFGDAAAADRPVFPLLDGLRQLGVAVEHPEGVPFTVTGAGGVRGRAATIDASGSSQFVSGLLIAAARFDEGLALTHRGAGIPSRPHIDMTIAMLRARGVALEQPTPDSWVVAPGRIAAANETIEPDLTNAATFLAAALVTGGSVEMAWPDVSLQASDAILAALTAFGADIVRTPGRVRLTGSRITGADVDLHAISELTPVVAALAALADGPSRIRGVAHIRGHETDRLAALEAEINGLGGHVRQTEDGLNIEPSPLASGAFHTHADHRLAHTAAVLGLAVPGIELDDVACTTKTLSDFPGLWATLVGA